MNDDKFDPTRPPPKSFLEPPKAHPLGDLRADIPAEVPAPPQPPVEEDKDLGEEKREEVKDLGPPTHQEDPHSPLLVCELPGGARPPDQAIAYTKLLVQEMTGEEDDVMRMEAPWHDRLNEMLGNLIISMEAPNGQKIRNKEKIRTMVSYLSAMDRLWAVIQIRRVSYGDLFRHRVHCPRNLCGGEAVKAVDLRKVTFTPMKDEYRTAATITSTIPRIGEVEWHVLRGIHQPALVEFQDKRARMTAALMIRLERVGDRKIHFGNAGDLQFLKRLPSGPRKILQRTMTKLEGDLDLACHYECLRCHHEWDDDFPVHDPDFFEPPEEEDTL